MPSREVFIFIPPSLKLVFYIFSLLSILVFLTGLYFKISIWQRGEDSKDSVIKDSSFLYLLSLSLRYFFSKECLLAKRVMDKSRLRGLMLIFIYWGFIILFAGTVIVAVDHYLKLNILQGTFYLLFSLVLDFSGLLVLTASAFYILRRIFFSKDVVSGWDDLPLLILISIIVISGFSIEGARIAITRPPLMDLSLVNALFSLIVKKDFFTPSVYIIFWIIHVFSALLFIAFIPFSKQFHMFSATITTKDAVFREKNLRRLVHE